MRKSVSVLSLSLLLGLRRLDTEIFGQLNNPIAISRMTKKGGGKPTKPAQGVCRCANPMPLTRTERDLLAGFPPGREKKRFVRQLKERYGRV